VKLLLFGATGLVGQNVLKLALRDPRIESVVAPTRRALLKDPKLHAPVVDFDRLAGDEPWWRADAAICALGTTIKTAGSRQAFERVDHNYPLMIARFAHQQGTPAFVLVSAIGANSSSPFFYNRVKGALEEDLRRVGFESLTLVRPSVIGGDRLEVRPGERALKAALTLVGPALPRSWRVNPAPVIARVLIDHALQPAKGVLTITSEMLV